MFSKIVSVYYAGYFVTILLTLNYNKIYGYVVEWNAPEI